MRRGRQKHKDLTFGLAGPMQAGYEKSCLAGSLWESPKLRGTKVVSSEFGTWKRSMVYVCQ